MMHRQPNIKIPNGTSCSLLQPGWSFVLGAYATGMEDNLFPLCKRSGLRLVFEASMNIRHWSGLCLICTVSIRPSMSLHSHLTFSNYCFRFLATGNSFRSLAFTYRMGRSTVSGIVEEVCEALWKSLQPIVMPEPNEEIWRASENVFKEKWNFPHCVAAIDGKHVRINPFNPELNPICYLLALLGAHNFLHVSRIRVKLLTFRLLMSYIHEAPILDVSRSHTTTQHSR